MNGMIADAYRTARFLVPALLAILPGCEGPETDEWKGGDSRPPFEPCARNLPDDDSWMRNARVGAVHGNDDLTDEEILDALSRLKARNDSTALLLDMFSGQIDDESFFQEASVVHRITCMAHELGIRVVVRYPSLEVAVSNSDGNNLTISGNHIDDWSQAGVDRQPDSTPEFSGTTTNTWMCPNGPYREVFLDRIGRLSATGVDAVLIADPVFHDPNASWSCTCSACSESFNEWSVRHGRWGAQGLQPPSEVDFLDPSFRAWVHWRHVTLADFIDKAADTIQARGACTWILVENHTLDHLNATVTGLDGAFSSQTERLSTFWEIDTLSGTLGMQWAIPEDFTSLVSMLKWATAADAGRPSWALSFAKGPGDASLLRGAMTASGHVPLVSGLTTPDRHYPLDFEPITDHRTLPPASPDRVSHVGLWYSSATRDYVDYGEGEGRSGMYVTTTSPLEDPGWWTADDSDSCAMMPHLGEWRGAANALIQLNVPFVPILSPCASPLDLIGLDLVWLPNVTALSSSDIRTLGDYVLEGGVLLATGDFPGRNDELGLERGINPMHEVFGVDAGYPVPDRVNTHGSGLAVYIGSGPGRNSLTGRPEDRTEAMSQIEKWIRIHASEDWIVRDGHDLYIDVARVSDHKHVIHLVDFSGLKGPFDRGVRDIEVMYRVPKGMRLTSLGSMTPIVGDYEPRFKPEGRGLYRLEASIDIFGMLELTLEKTTKPRVVHSNAGPVFNDPFREEAARSGIRFVLDVMRDSTLDGPWRFGVLECLSGHDYRTKSEDMGLLLQAAACMGDDKAWKEAFHFIDQVMLSPSHHVVYNAVDPDLGRPGLTRCFPGGPWRNFIDPLGDIAIVRGLLAGARSIGRTEGTGLAQTIMNGLYWNGVTSRYGEDVSDFPDRLGGLIGSAWKWEGTDEPEVYPQAFASGHGDLDVDIMPVEFQDLEVMGEAASFNPRWGEVLVNATGYLLDSEITRAGPPIGLYFNGMEAFSSEWTGDHESKDTVHGRHLKTVQEIRTALHLARLSGYGIDFLDYDHAMRAIEAAGRTLKFLRLFHEAEGRIPEYLTIRGTDVPDCQTNPRPDCLYSDFDNRYEGDVVIYALAARLAIELGDLTFASTLIEEHILTDRVGDSSSPFHGKIGLSTVPSEDADATQVLQSVLTLCQEARATIR